MQAALEKLREDMNIMDRRLTGETARHETWMRVHDVDCARRYEALKGEVQRAAKSTAVGMVLLAAADIGLKSKFGEAILKMIGLL